MNGSPETKKTSPGFLIMNADDWGRDRVTTDKIVDCAAKGSVSSVSAMVFMDDSQRSADLARERGIEGGLHINFTLEFSDPKCPPELLRRQRELGRFLLWHRFTRVLYHPGLAQAFDYVTRAQYDEYERLYGHPARKVDGHHHMHLCANVLRQQLLPDGVLVRKGFSFFRGEKSALSRVYRHIQNQNLGRRHRVTDYFFSLPPLTPESRLRRIFDLAKDSVVELETHPINPDEYEYLTKGRIFQDIGTARIAPPSAMLS